MAKKSTSPRARARFTPEYEALLRLLVDARKRAGLTQAAIAQHLGKAQSHIAKIEAQDREIGIVDVWRWCEAVDVPFDELMGQFQREVQQLQDGKKADQKTNTKNKAAAAKPASKASGKEK